MGIITGLLTLPLAPVRGTVWIAEQLAAEAERQLYGAQSARRRLLVAERQLELGVLSEEDAQLERRSASRSRRRADASPSSWRWASAVSCSAIQTVPRTGASGRVSRPVKRPISGAPGVATELCGGGARHRDVIRPACAAASASVARRSSRALAFDEERRSEELVLARLLRTS